MTEIEQLLKLIQPQIPITVDLWSVREIAAYLKRNPNNVRDRVTKLPGFPTPIRLPTESGKRGQPLWKAKEVIAWAEKHRDAA
ncbi:MAG TPA: hypothetical protein ENI94_13070 [Gammaproteobacteria bacterium]|nr:hypothetical protein [Gammaproteobacteria bacterium]